MARKDGRFQFAIIEKRDQSTALNIARTAMRDRDGTVEAERASDPFFVALTLPNKLSEFTQHIRAELRAAGLTVR